MLTAALICSVVSTTLIEDGTIIDGTGKPAYVGDIRIQSGKIIAVGQLNPQIGDRVINARGMVVAPGFIDAHSHAAGGILEEPTAISQVTQGITTAVVGQDGGWSQPIEAEFAEIMGVRPAINFAHFSGHGGIRRKIMGQEYKRLATAVEIEKMAALVEADMKAGALGLSTGLEYDPGYYSNTAEIVALAKVAAKHGGLYISHVRDEADKAFEAFDEVVQISRQAKIQAQISHIKLGTKAVWGRAKETDKIGIKKGLTADVYPYLYWHSTISALSPSRDWGNRAIWDKGLADVGGPQNVRLVSYTHEPSWVGKTLVQIAEQTGKDPIALIQEILEKTEGPNGSGSQHVVVTAMTDGDLEHFIKSPRTMFCSDGAIGGRHPRGAGSFPRILGRYVREKRLISWEEAIRKMTSFPAQRFKLKGIGQLKRGYAADVVIFDPKSIIDNATPANPTALSTGVREVWVSGVRVLKDGTATGDRGGRKLLRAR